VKALHEGVTEDQVFEAWRVELLNHRESAKSALAKQAIEEWSKRDNVPYWQIHTMNLIEGSGTSPLRWDPASRSSGLPPLLAKAITWKTSS
jgi:hypothetical protein